MRGYAGVRPAMLTAAAVRVSTVGLFGVLPVLATVAFLWAAVGNDYAFDFRQFWQGGRDVLDGVSPYPTHESLKQAGDWLGPHGIQDVFRFPYPAGSAIAMVPLALLPFGAAAAVLTVILVAATFAALRLLDVRDWRCYGVAFLSIAVLTAIRLGTLTPLLLLALALAWRYRDRRWVVAGALAGAIVLKLFLWPLVGWLLATRRFAAAGLTAALAAGVTLLAWLAIGLDGLTVYPELTRKLSDVVADRGYSLVALGSMLGLGDGVARMLPLVGGAALLGAVVVAARRRDGDRLAFTLAVVASILFTPIVWLHYFALLLVPIALADRRLGPLWLVPLAFWVTPFQETEGQLWRVLVALGLTGVVAWATTVGVPTRLASRTSARYVEAGT